MPHTAFASDTIRSGKPLISVVLDQARVLKVPDGTATLIVGNPLIADVSVQAGNVLVVTGKGYGVTNLLALDRSGSVLMESNVEVQSPQQAVVVVHRGTARESYSCTPDCERRITLGDSPEYFAATLGQAGAFSAQAQGGGGQPANGAAPR